MATVYLGAILVILAAMMLSLYRACQGASWYDRIMAGNSFSTQVALLISIYFFAAGQPEYIDIALLYALISYVGSLALVSYFKDRGPTSGRDQ